MVYTTFAIVATSMLILLVSFTAIDSEYTSDTNPFRIGQASFYLDNVENDLDRAYDIAFQRGTSGAVNYIVETGNETENPTEALRNATVRGVINSYELENTRNATLTDWKERVEEAAGQSKYSLSIEYTDMSVEDDYMQLQGNLTAFLTMKDPVSLARFNSTQKYSSTQRIEGLEDPMILVRSRGRYINTFNSCGFNDPANQLLTGNGDDGSTYGNATIITDDGANLAEVVNNRSEKVLVTDDLEPYIPDQMDTINDFAGVVSAEPLPSGGGGPGGPPGGGGPDGTSEEDYETKYVFDTGTIAPVNEQMRLILYNDQVWNSNIREVISSGCYMESTETANTPAGPGFLERMDNELTSKAGEEEGLSTIINKSELPSQLREVEASNVDYVYFNDTGSYGAVSGIAGVTGGEAHGNREYRESFRLDQEHIEKWNLKGLSY